jgi:hypothetical protein|tara:strand:+ start:113 stop:475 length:363 start_codon:yes stop_codon:yes gene_type:complete
MEENLQKNNFQNQKQNFGQNPPHKGYPVALYVIFLIIIAGVVFFLYISSSDTGLFESESKKTFTKEEKLEILDSLSSDSEDIPSIEERREILNNVTQSRSNDLYNYSEEGKLQILRSLQE